MVAIKDNDLLENKEVRENLMSDRNLDIINKVKEIVWLGDDEVTLIDKVTDYYRVSKSTIESVVEDNREELNRDGLQVLRKKKLKLFKGSTLKECNLYEEYKYARQLTIFPRRAVLRVGMLLRDSEVAKTIRSYLLNVEEVADAETKEWSIKREAGKLIRKQYTGAIARSGENKRMYGWAYQHYTNLAYKIVFGKRAKDLYRERNAPNGKLRDYFTEEELEVVIEIENTVAGLLNVGFTYNEIKNLLINKLNKNMLKTL